MYQGNYVACLIAMLQQMDEKHYQMYVQHFPTDQDLLVSFIIIDLLSFLKISHCAMIVANVVLFFRNFLFVSI